MSEITISLPDTGPAGDRDETALFDLKRRLTAEDDARGRLRVVAQPPAQGTLGVPADVLMLLVEPGALAVLASVLVTWLRGRRSTVRLEIRRGDGKELSLSADRVAGLDGERLRGLVEEIADALQAPESRPPAVERAGRDAEDAEHGEARPGR
ncbi:MULTISPECIES: effector-associated constant component EACC1 [Streptomyces]|nr:MULTISPECIES: hypothetical protein [Streptomyces]MCG0067851.1 hypothetical protein [Streptomyces tricolor]MYU30974.1 hypothetical protein [Streptomyces sp. SID7810]OYP14524.1 hypothetical protein CFC35_08300 [Streptomyces sp. FBKL.4005]